MKDQKNMYPRRIIDEFSYKMGVLNVQRCNKYFNNFLTIFSRLFDY
jgi:hypothetical protein